MELVDSRFLTQSPTGYHAFPILQVLIVLIGVFIILNNFEIWFRIAIATLITITPSFVISFFGLIFPERNVIFWLTILLVCFQYFLKTRSPLYFSGALIAAQFALYYKEPVFLLIAGFAGTRLFLYSLFERNLLQRRRYWQFLKTHCVEVWLLVLTVLFLLIYILIFLPSMNAEYASSRSIGVFPVLVNYLQSDWLLGVFLLAVSLRVFYLIFSKKSPDLFWDALAVGTFLYFLSYIKLEIFTPYYMAPVDFIAILYLGQLVYPWLKNRKVALSTVTTLVVCLILGQNKEL